jgi:hypothetical protein
VITIQGEKVRASSSLARDEAQSLQTSKGLDACLVVHPGLTGDLASRQSPGGVQKHAKNSDLAPRREDVI